MKFNNREKLEMILIYGKCNNNATRAKDMYAEKYPERVQPSRKIFQRLCTSLRETGSFHATKRNVAKTITSEDNTISVLAAVAENPNSSIRQISRGSGISRTSINRILRKEKYHPYHLECHQMLHGTDYANRVRFCQWFLHKMHNNDSFLQTVLFSDEATFTNRGKISSKNMVYWASENPHWMREIDHQRQWSINVWCGILGGRIIGPYFMGRRLTGLNYAHFLSEILATLLEDVPLRIRTTMWYQHDGCPAHYANIAKEVLDELFPNKWIGRGGEVPWPPRSPDLTPLDYFLWGTLKNMVYHEPPTTPENMKERIRQACATLNAETIQDSVSSLINRLHHCINLDGHHFEHLR